MYTIANIEHTRKRCREVPSFTFAAGKSLAYFIVLVHHLMWRMQCKWIFMCVYAKKMQEFDGPEVVAVSTWMGDYHNCIYYVSTKWLFSGWCGILMSVNGCGIKVIYGGVKEHLLVVFFSSKLSTSMRIK